MDFSAVQDEHPESSPWATSPQPTRSGFDAQSPFDAAVTPADHDESPEHPFASEEGNLPPAAKGPQGHQQQQQQHTGGDGVDHTPASSATPHHPPSQPQHQHAQQQPQQQRQPVPGTQQRAPGAGARPRQERPQYKIQFKLTSLERNGRKDPILKFDVYTNLPRFRTTQYRDVRRTHSEFQKLAEHLMSANPEAMVPAVPPPVTAAGAGTEEDETKVKGNMQRWLTIVSSNEILIRDEEVQLFVESDFGYSPVVRRKQPATGMRRKVIKQFAPPPDECHELADARPIVKLYYLGTMDVGQKVDRVVKRRRSLGLAESQLGIGLAQLSPQENHPGLSMAYRKLGNTIRAVGDFHLAQGTFEASTLSDPLAYHSSDAFIVKETLTNRQILMRELLTASTNTRNRVSAADRLRSSSSVKRDKVDEAIAALEEAKRTEESLQRKCAGVTRALVAERRRWFERTASSLRASVREYVIRQIEAERRTLATLEAVRPDIRGIDTSGGLSRLGREHHPKVRRSSLASSQGPKGDAWSGVPRRPDGVRRVDSSSGGISGVAEEGGDGFGDEGLEGVESLGRSVVKGSLKGLVEEDDEDRVDARNAASRLAQTTF